MGVFIRLRSRYWRELARVALTCVTVITLGLALTACAADSRATRTALPTPTSRPDLTCSPNSPVTAPLFAPAIPQATLALPGAPFASLASPDGKWLFVSLAATKLPPGSGAHDTSGLAVLRRTGAQSATLAHIFPLPPNPLGLALSPDGRLLAVADYSGVLLFDITLAEAGSQRAEVGQFATTPNASTIEVLFSPDGKYVFAANEQTANISVFHLLTTGLQTPLIADDVGSIPTGPYPVGMALAPDGARFYAASLISAAAAHVYGPSPRLGVAGGLAEIDLSRAERDPAKAVVGEALTGCQPVRVALSPDGKIAWVTAQSSDTLQAFDTSRIATDPQRALLATVGVGSNPTGLLLVNSGRYALVTNSNRWAPKQTPQTVTVVDTQRALAGKPSLVGNIPAGIFPRDVMRTSDTIVVTNFGSDTISLINATTLP